MNIKECFGTSKPVIGMIHLLPLPGSICFDEIKGIDYVINKAKSDYESLVKGGIDGVLFCNENDKPYSKRASNVQVASLTRIITEITHGKINVPFGVDFQWDPLASLAIAYATRASFIRGVLIGSFVGDLGYMIPDTLEIFKKKKQLFDNDILLLTHLQPEFSDNLDKRELPLKIESISKSTNVDVICVSGNMAGQLTSAKTLKEIKNKSLETSIFINTGVSFENIEDVLNAADGCIVATSIKHDGASHNRIDEKRVEKLMQKVKKLRSF
jgi:membrane complex biogenesis BtpA family protein